MPRPATAVTALWRRWPWLVDLVPLILEGPAIADLLGTGRRGHEHVAGPVAWILAQALIVPLLLRRRYPRSVFGLLTVVAAVQAFTSGPSVADFALLVALYTIAVQCARQQAFLAAAVLEVGVLVAAFGFQPVGDDILASIVFLTGLVAAALFTGTGVRARRDYLASLEDRAERLERESGQRAELAATAERTRIAREMHDIVAHSLSVVITLADGAVAAAPTDPEGAAAAMSHVGETGRQALAEMRRLLGVLRDERPADREPQPDLARLAALLEDVRNTGLPVRFTVTGAPPLLLPSTAQATIYRIVQESLTNVLKHAAEPLHVCVQLDWHPGEVTVEVSDDGGATVATTRTDGHGLSGIAERVALFNGELTSGPVDPHGWQVRARLQFENGTA